MISVLFVCMGNICRSPSGEGIFKFMVEREGISDRFFIDSAGTTAYHVGERADKRMRKHAALRNIELTSRARQFSFSDFDKFDYILAMDNKNFQDICRMDRGGKNLKKIFLMNDFSQTHKGSDVPDPYYGGAEGFERVLDMLEESCLGLLNRLKDNL